MNEDFTSLNKALQDFVEQDDHSTLFLIASFNDLVVPTKLLDAQSRQSQDSVYLMAVNECEAVDDWMSGIIAMLDGQVKGVNHLRAEEDLPFWPQLPMECMNPLLPPEERLRVAADYCASVVPDPDKVTWVLLPCVCNDREGYARLVMSLCGGESWLDRHRFIVWDDKSNPLLVPDLKLQKNEDVLLIDIDFSAASQLDKLTQIAQDPARSSDNRMDALFQLAAVDFSYRRYDQSVEKYGALFQYYEGKDKTRQSMCLLGTGDVAMQQKQAEAALNFYRSGIAIAISEKTLPVLLQLFMGAGRACLQLAIYKEAEDYFEYANAIAGKLSSPYVKADALELKGLSQLNQEKGSEAIDTWDVCWKFCQEFPYEERWQSVLNRQYQLYQQANMSSEAFGVNLLLSNGFKPVDKLTVSGSKEVKQGAPA